MPKYPCQFCTDGPFDSPQARGAHEFAKHVRTYALAPIEHGTVSGYQKHKRRDTQPCAKCRAAWRDYYQKKRSSPH